MILCVGCRCRESLCAAAAMAVLLVWCCSDSPAAVDLREGFSQGRAAASFSWHSTAVLVEVLPACSSRFVSPAVVEKKRP